MSLVPIWILSSDCMRPRSSNGKNLKFVQNLFGSTLDTEISKLNWILVIVLKLLFQRAEFPAHPGTKL